MTDKIGHAQDFENARNYLSPLAEFLREALRQIDLDATTVIITSDYGNSGDLSVRTHPLDDVQTVAWGRNRHETDSRIKDSTDTSPAILNLLD